MLLPSSWCNIQSAFALVLADSSSPGGDNWSAWNCWASSEGWMRPGNQGLPRKHPPAHCLPAGLPQERQRAHAVLPATAPPRCPAGSQLRRYGHTPEQFILVCSTEGRVGLLWISKDLWRGGEGLSCPIWELSTLKCTAVSDLFEMPLSWRPFSLLIIVFHGFELCIFSECLCPAPPFFVCNELHSNTGIKPPRSLFKRFYSYWKLEGSSGKHPFAMNVLQI